MGKLYHGTRIYRDTNTGREIQHPVSFMLDDVLDIEGSKGQSLPFDTPGPKVYVRLSGSRGMWLLERLSEFRALWERYLTGAPKPTELDTTKFNLN